MSGIFNLKQQEMGRFLLRVERLRHANGDMAAFREFHGVAQQIQQNLPQAAFIRADEARQIGRRADCERQAFFFDAQPENIFNLMQQPEQVYIRQMKRHAPRFDFRQIQHVIDHRQQMLPAAPDNVKMFVIFRRKAAAPAHQLRKAQNRVQRGAQFVAHVRQKHAFGVIRRFCRDFRALQFRDKLLQLPRPLRHLAFQICFMPLQFLLRFSILRQALAQPRQQKIDGANQFAEFVVAVAGENRQQRLARMIDFNGRKAAHNLDQRARRGRIKNRKQRAGQHDVSNKIVNDDDSHPAKKIGRKQIAVHCHQQIADVTRRFFIGH